MALNKQSQQSHGLYEDRKSMFSLGTKYLEIEICKECQLKDPTALEETILDKFHTIVKIYPQ
jgi:hypothetical protein